MNKCPKCSSAYALDFTHCPKDGSRLESINTWLPGSTIKGKYRILSVIGAGGMATVYKAEHIRFGEIRALKVISAELGGDPGFVRRFIQEAVVTRRLQHMNAVHVEDVDEDEDGRPFIVMEFIEGRTLQQVMSATGPMAVERVCSLTKQIAEALDAAHGLGIVHRDLKPGNVIIQHRSEIARVLDFGIAKVMESPLEGGAAPHSTLTIKGMVIGTPAYMSPEQAMGNSGGELDGRSDIYSLGIVTYEMLTGDLPLHADSEMGFRIAHIGTVPTPISNRRPDLPEPLVNLVMSCLAKDREHRPTSARAFIDVIKDSKDWSGRRQAATRKSAERVHFPYEQIKAQQPAKGRKEAQEVTRLKLTSPRTFRLKVIFLIFTFVFCTAVLVGFLFRNKPPTPGSVDPPLAIEAPPLGIEALKNATYRVEGDDVTLKDGSGQDVSGSNNAELENEWAVGDLDGNGSQDAAVVLAENGGGTGIFKYLIPVINNAGIPKPLQGILLGDRCVIKSVKILDKVVSVQLLTQGPNDGLCCPTLLETLNFRLSGKEFKCEDQDCRTAMARER